MPTQPPGPPRKKQLSSPLSFLPDPGPLPVTGTRLPQVPNLSSCTSASPSLLNLETEEVAEFRIISVRQPWANALLEGQKKIENRSFPIPPFLENVWLGLYVSQKFTEAEKSQSWKGKPSNEFLSRNCGRMIGLLKFQNVTEAEACEVDPFFTNKPVKTTHHWKCVGRIKLEKSFPYTANVRWTRVGDIETRRLLAKVLKDRGLTQPSIPVPKPNKKYTFSCPVCGQTRKKKSTLRTHLRRDHGVTEPLDIQPDEKACQYVYPCCGVADGSKLSIGCDLCDSWWHEFCLQMEYCYSEKYLKELTSVDTSVFKCPHCVAKKTGMNAEVNTTFTDHKGQARGITFRL